MVFLIIIGVIVSLLVSFLVANEFYKIAAEKGFDEKKYLWLSFFFGLAGYLLVIALPDRKNSRRKYIITKAVRMRLSSQRKTVQKRKKKRSPE